MRVTGVAAAVPRNVVYTTDFDFFTPEEAGVFAEFNLQMQQNSD